jgi:DNA-binding XRE family transcriptional regulator
MLRLFKEMTQKQMAVKLGISQQAYSKLERHPWVDAWRMDEILTMVGVTLEKLEEIRKASTGKK